MSSIFKALSSPFRIDSRGTNENAYSSYGQDEKLEFYILFSLNGFLGREKSGAHRAIISFCRPSTCLVKFTDQRDTKRLGVISIDIDSLAAISILSRYYKASSPAQKTGKATKYDSMKALDKLLKQTVVTGEKANYKARLRKARINRWKWRRKHNF